MQKKILPLCLALLAFLPLTAQVKKGTVVLGAGVNISTAPKFYLDYDGNGWQRRTQFQLEAGKAVKNNLLLGVRLGSGTAPVNEYTLNNGRYAFNYSTSRFYTGEVFLKKYAPMGKKFAFFAEATLTGLTNRYNSTDPYGFAYSNLKIRQVSLSGSMGVSYQMFKRISFEFSFNNLLSFRYATAKGTETDLSNGQVTQVRDKYLSMNPFSGVNRSAGIGIKIRLGKQ